MPSKFEEWKARQAGKKPRVSAQTRRSSGTTARGAGASWEVAIRHGLAPYVALDRETQIAARYIRNARTGEKELQQAPAPPDIRGTVKTWGLSFLAEAKSIDVGKSFPLGRITERQRADLYACDKAGGIAGVLIEDRASGNIYWMSARSLLLATSARKTSIKFEALDHLGSRQQWSIKPILRRHVVEHIEKARQADV